MKSMVDLRLTKQNTLIIFDEIQQCAEAITSIKYFEESGLNLYLLCAGSLLGVELKRRKISFPVGKDEQLKLYPLDFYEFTKALGGAKYLDLLSSFDLHREVPAYIYEPLLQYLKLYYIVGGMPEAVKSYIETEDLTKVDQVLDRIIQDLRNDFAHHAEPKDIIKIGWVWDSIPKQLAKDNNKFVSAFSDRCHDKPPVVQVCLSSHSSKDAFDMRMADPIRTVWNRPEWISLYADVRPMSRISAISPTV